MNYLFLFTITPVQDFISQSRKLKDLFGSSEILSYMSYIGMRICKKYGGEIIFPSFEDVSNKSYPNRFLVKFDKDKEEIRIIAKEIEESLLKYLRGLDNLNHSKIKEHIENYFTFYWTFSEIKDSYKNAFDEVEKKLAGAKNTRFFNQLGNGEGERGRKCSICGERNVVVYNGKLPMPKEQIEKEKPLRNKIAQIGEGLCGVCYVKRANSSQKKFDSTADIALMHISGLEKFTKLALNSQLFYEENLREKFIKEQKIKYSLDELKKEFKDFQNYLKENNLKQTSYYSVIMLDGDNMGEWLSGKRLKRGNLKEFHKFLSESLLNFAGSLEEVFKNKGIKIYAGGDDLLGFVNLNYLFDVLYDIQQLWNEKINQSIKNRFEVKKDFTFSTGVVLAHYKTPLRYVLEKIRLAEKEAKNSGRDSICFMALKRSGEIRKGIVKNKNLKNLAYIQRELKGYSDSFISKLEKEFTLIENSNRLSMLLIAELKRLFDKSEIKDEELLEKFKILTANSNKFASFSGLLNIIKFINREMV